MTPQIYKAELTYGGYPVPFAIRALKADTVPIVPEEPHRHNYYTLVWPFSFWGSHIIDFREYSIEADHLFFVSPGQVHQIITKIPARGIVIQFTCEFLEKYSIREDFISNVKLFGACDETPPLQVNERMKKQLKIYTDNMFEIFSKQDEMGYEALGAWLKLFLIECNNHCTLAPDQNPQRTEVGRNIVRRFKTAVEKNFQTWHQVQEYADTLNVTPNYLNEVLKTALGQSAKDYIQNRIILEARRMRLFTHKSNKEIGFSLGFEDPAHFSKFYKSRTGRTLEKKV